MQTLIKISWRNIWRNRTRSIVIIIAIVLGLMGGVFSAGMRLGVETQQFEETVENQISHIQIHHPSFIANPEAHYRIDEGIADVLRQMPGVKTVTARTVFDGMIATANMNAGVRIKGVHPPTEALTTGLDQLLEEGSFFTDQGRLPSVILGQRLANDLRATIGSRIILTFQDIAGEMVSASFRVEGIYSVTSLSFEERTVFVKANALNQLIDDPNAVTEVAVVLENPDNYREAAAQIQEKFPQTKVRHWADMAPSLYYSLEFLHQNLAWIVGIIILGVSFGLLNTILMSVLERVNELGILMAIGMKKRKVFSMIVMETTLLSVVGGLIGITLSYLMVILLNIRGVDLSGTGGDGLGEFGYASLVYLKVPPNLYYEIGILVIVFAILASVYPALKAIRLQPAEAVRQE